MCLASLQQDTIPQAEKNSYCFFVHTLSKVEKVTYK